MTYAVEQRGTRFYVVDRGKGWELAPVFDNRVTAEEVAEKASAQVPFFDNIPVCQLDSPPDDRRGARPLGAAERGLG